MSQFFRSEEVAKVVTHLLGNDVGDLLVSTTKFVEAVLFFDGARKTIFI